MDANTDTTRWPWDSTRKRTRFRKIPPNLGEAPITSFRFGKYFGFAPGLEVLPVLKLLPLSEVVRIPRQDTLRKQTADV